MHWRIQLSTAIEYLREKRISVPFEHDKLEIKFWSRDADESNCRYDDAYHILDVDATSVNQQRKNWNENQSPSRVQRRPVSWINGKIMLQ